MRKIALGSISVLLAGALATGCAQESENPEPAATPPAATGTGGTADPGTRVADIVASPETYIGQTVTVTADVEEVFGPRAFALDEDAPLAGGVDQDLLVLSRKAGNLDDIDDQWLKNKVRVTGKVGRWKLVELEREIGWDLDPEIEAEVERAGAVLIASSLSRVQ